MSRDAPLRPHLALLVSQRAQAPQPINLSPRGPAFPAIPPPRGFSSLVFNPAPDNNVD